MLHKTKECVCIGSSVGLSNGPSVYFSVFYQLSLTANDSNFTAKVCLPSIGMAFSVNHMFMHD